jgi:hypothetical protein
MPSFLEAAPKRREGQVSMAKTMKEWLDAGLYLPRRIRDFHDQKEVFKLIWRQVMAAQERAKLEGSPTPFEGEFSWVMAHCFVIDQFLWFMARHGWTLQRTRAREGFKFDDLDDAVQAYKDAEAAAFREMLDRQKAEREIT